MSKIQSSEISVVIQGPIEGKPDDPYEKRWTYQACESVRKHLPDAEIILSTWEGSDCTDLSYDKLVLSKDPGVFSYRLSNGSYFRANMNINRQIVSSKEGLKHCLRKYAMKMRSNTVLTGDNFLGYFDLYTKRCNDCRILKKRVLALAPVNPKRVVELSLYFPGDWHFFGLSEDVLDIWDIDLANEHEKGIHSEQIMWSHFLNKHFDKKVDLYDRSSCNKHKSLMSFINNLVFIQFHDFNIASLKHIKNGATCYSHLFLYTHNDFIRLYNKYCNDDIPLRRTSFSVKELFCIILYCMHYVASIIVKPMRKISPDLLNRVLTVWVSFLDKIRVS